MYRYPFRHPLSSFDPIAPPTIEVVGEGSVSLTPDQAVVILGTVTQGTVLQTVQADNAAAITAIIQALMKLGIPREKIQTSDYRVEVQYDYQDGKQIFRGYQVTHLLKVITDQVGQTGALVDTAVAHGANTVSNIQFTVAHPEPYENNALSLAVRNARQKAESIANTLGVYLDAAPRRIQELSRTAEPILYKTATLAAIPATPVQPGQLTIKASVRALYGFH